ncbi:MAG: hypothetical protein JW878_04520 [Methanomicrobia archaeon]|nr:hypothetical protein [Methanomicrobia archaeon]
MCPLSKTKKAYLDVTVSICPHCGAPYADASWYALELGSDVECGVCGRTWNPKTCKVDRILVEIELDDEGNVAAVRKETCLE